MSKGDDLESRVEKKTSWSKVDTFYRIKLPLFTYGTAYLMQMGLKLYDGAEIFSPEAQKKVLIPTAIIGTIGYGLCYVVSRMMRKDKLMQRLLTDFIYHDEKEFDSKYNDKGMYKEFEKQLEKMSEEKGKFESFISKYVGKLGYYNLNYKLLIKDAKEMKNGSK